LIGLSGEKQIQTIAVDKKSKENEKKIITKRFKITTTACWLISLRLNIGMPPIFSSNGEFSFASLVVNMNLRIIVLEFHCAMSSTTLEKSFSKNVKNNFPVSSFLTDKISRLKIIKMLFKKILKKGAFNRVLMRLGII
jgi:hypothetical protein